MIYFMQGLLFGLAYVMPIGIQNMYVINSAMQRNVKIICLTTIFVIIFDISLAISCYLGIGILLDKYKFLCDFVMFIGAMVIFYIAFDLWRTNSKLEIKSTHDYRLSKIIISAFSVAWLNSQAIIDGSLILGSFRTSLAGDSSIYFIIGVCIASCLWFSSLAFIAHKFINKLYRFVKYINLICAIILFLYGLNLLYMFCLDLFTYN